MLHNVIGRVVIQIFFGRVVPLSGGDAGMPCGSLHPKDFSTTIDGQTLQRCVAGRGDKSPQCPAILLSIPPHQFDHCPCGDCLIRGWKILNSILSFSLGDVYNQWVVPTYLLASQMLVFLYSSIRSIKGWGIFTVVRFFPFPVRRRTWWPQEVVIWDGVEAPNTQSKRV